MNLTLVPLDKSLGKAPFHCGNPQLDDYFRHYALKNDQLSLGKTFVALLDNGQIAGYLTISTAQVLAEALPRQIQTKLPRYPVPAFRISRLAVDKSFQGMGVGSWLLWQAMTKALDISEQVGIFAMLVDALDDRSRAFYTKYGFIPFEDKPLTLFLPLATIRAARDNSGPKGSLDRSV